MNRSQLGRTTMKTKRSRPKLKGYPKRSDISAIRRPRPKLKPRNKITGADFKKLKKRKKK